MQGSGGGGSGSGSGSSSGGGGSGSGLNGLDLGLDYGNCFLNRFGRLIVEGLVGLDGAGGADGGDGALTGLGSLEHQMEAAVDDLLGSGGIGLDGGGSEGELTVLGNIADGGDQHEGTEVLHTASLVVENGHYVGEIGVACNGHVGSLRLLSRRCIFCHFFALNFGDQAINILKESVDIFIKRLSGLNLAHFLAEIVDRLEHDIEQGKPVGLRYDIHGILANQEEHILDAMCHSCQSVEFHHGGRTLDGMHDAEDFVDVVLRECAGRFRIQHDCL